jgi:hypothetical protein
MQRIYRMGVGGGRLVQLGSLLLEAKTSRVAVTLHRGHRAVPDRAGKLTSKFDSPFAKFEEAEDTQRCIVDH